MNFLRSEMNVEDDGSRGIKTRAANIGDDHIKPALRDACSLLAEELSSNR